MCHALGGTPVDLRRFLAGSDGGIAKRCGEAVDTFSKWYKNKDSEKRSEMSWLHGRELLITDNLRKAIENNQYSCGDFLDFSTAFDTVNHAILLEKLQLYGIRGVVLQFFTSYLVKRHQFVLLWNTVSPQTITCRIPQAVRSVRSYSLSTSTICQTVLMFWSSGYLLMTQTYLPMHVTSRLLSN